MSNDASNANALLSELIEVVDRHVERWRAEGVPPSHAGANLMAAGIRVCAEMISRVARADARGPVDYIGAALPLIVRQLFEATFSRAGVPAEVEVERFSDAPEATQ